MVQTRAQRRAAQPSPPQGARSLKRARATPPASSVTSPAGGSAAKRRRQTATPSPQYANTSAGMVQRLEELDRAYCRAKTRQSDSYTTVLQLAGAFVKDHGADCMPRMTQMDAEASWAQLSMGVREVDEAAERLCKTVLSMVNLRAHAQAETRQEGRLASLAFDVLAILACGQPGTAAVMWLLDNAAELARAAARDDGCETVQFSAVVCIHNLIYFEQGAERLAKDMEAVKAATHTIVQAMAKHTPSERVQNCGLLFCRNLSSHHEGEAALLTLGLEPVLLAVVAALEAHPTSERVQCHGISCLKYLTETETCAEVVVSSACGARVVQASLTAMQKHTDSVSVLERAVAFLKNITWGASQGCATVLNAGGVPHLLSAMSSHRASEAVQEGGVSALRNLWMSTAGEVALLQHNGVETVLTALKEHLKSVVVCVHVMSFFKHAADSDNGAARMLEIDVLTHLLAAVTAHPDAVEIQQRGLLCLFNLAFDVPGVGAVAAHAAAVVDWALPLVTGPKKELQSPAAKLLGRLAASSAGRFEILRHADTVAMLERASMLSMAALDQGTPDDDDSELSPKTLTILGQELVKGVEDEAVRKAMGRAHNAESTTLAAGCSQLRLAPAQARSLFIEAGGMAHLFSPHGLASPEHDRRGLAANSIQSVLRIAGVRCVEDALPTPPPPPMHAVHDFSRFVDNPAGADAVFVVGSRRWHAHRVVLAASTASDVFAAMFERSGAQMQEAAGRRAAETAEGRPKKRTRRAAAATSPGAAGSGGGGAGGAGAGWSTAPLVEIVLEDLEPEIFGYILRELYGVPQLNIPNEHIVGVLVAAGRFLLQPLRMRCVRQLVRDMDNDTVWQLFTEVVPLVCGGGASEGAEARDPAAAALEGACAFHILEQLARTRPVLPVVLPPPPPTHAERRASGAAAAAAAVAAGDAVAAAAVSAAEEAQAILDRVAWESLAAAEGERVKTAEATKDGRLRWFAAQLGVGPTPDADAAVPLLPTEKLAQLGSKLDRSVGWLLETSLAREPPFTLADIPTGAPAGDGVDVD